MKPCRWIAAMSEVVAHIVTTLFRFVAGTCVVFPHTPIELEIAFLIISGGMLGGAAVYWVARSLRRWTRKREKKSSKEILEVQEARLRFLTDISHELQTPVAILRANMEILNRRARGDHRAARLVIDDTLEHMAQMIDHLLAVARLNFSREKFDWESVAVHCLLEDVYHDCLALTDKNRVIFSYVSEEIFVRGDRSKLREVILNLVSNALKHTGCGGTISLVGRAKGGEVAIVVEDTGCGIDRSELPRIFERFYQIHRGDARPISGNGIGLNICKQIVEAHDGTITVESEKGKGSAFIITLPADSGRGCKAP